MTTRQHSAKVLAAVGSAIGVDEILLALALALVTVGLWPLAGVSALVVPGLVLLWLALPSRAAFVLKPPVPLDQARRKR